MRGPRRRGPLARGGAAVLVVTALLSLARGSEDPATAQAGAPGGGYWLVARDGGIFAYGDAGFYGAARGMRLSQPIVGMAARPTAAGYWLVAADGGIFAFGDARFHGSTGGLRLNAAIVGMAATPSGGGYWLVAADGGIFAFGDARFHGSTGGLRLNAAIVGMAATPSGSGYWLVAADGGIFAFGDARFHGSTGGLRLNAAIVSMAGTRSGGGYWLVAADGGIFAFGDAGFHGSTGGLRLNQPIVGMAATPVPSPPPPPPPPPADVLAAGDIADCGSAGDEATAAVLDRLAGTVLTLGDNAYDSGTLDEFNRCYQPSWGRHKARTRPSPGNHEYATPGAAGYFGYFGPAAGDPSRGYYSFDVGGWHVVSLNSEDCSDDGDCWAQEAWLRADLATHPSLCTLAYWHHPRFSSGRGDRAYMAPLWNALADFGADVVLAGHDHIYERFAPLSPTGSVDPVRGMRQFTAGTGGRSHHSIGPVRAGSEARNADTYGVLQMTLRTSGYDWRFEPEAGRSFTDSGSGACH